jgi:divalent metal cation (Fe/Co/Zn/Cd) transporter
MQHGPGDALRGMRIRRFLIVILIANITVVVAKLVIGLATESVAVPGDTAHSSVDVMNNLLGLAVIRIGSQEPDEDPPYRQQKVETLGAFASVAFLSASPIQLAEGANTRAAIGAPGLSVSVYEITILAGTLVVNGGLCSRTHSLRSSRYQSSAVSHGGRAPDCRMRLGLLRSELQLREIILRGEPC